MSKFEIINDLKVIKKNIIFEKNYWKISASHDGYLKKYNLIFMKEKLNFIRKISN